MTEAPGKLDRPLIRALVLMLMGTAGLRCGMITAGWQQLGKDPDAYRLIAENLRQHGVYSRSQEGEPLQSTAFRPPLYPMLLATCAWDGHVSSTSVAVLHLALGVLSVLLAWILARSWGLGSWSYLVAVLVACDPILLSQSTQVMTETLATFLTIASLLALTRMSDVHSWKTCLMAGLLLGLAALCRPTFLIWTALIAGWVVVFWWRRSGMRLAAVMLTGFLVVLAPWAIRNQLVMGRPIVATTHGGYTLLLGNNSPFYAHLRHGEPGSVWDARELLPLLESAAESAGQENTGQENTGQENTGQENTGQENTGQENTGQENTGQENTGQENTGQENTGQENTGQGSATHPELLSDRQLYGLAHETIVQEPVMFAYSSLVRMARFWTPLPHRLSDNESSSRALARFLVAVWYSVIFLVALVGLWRIGRGNLVPPWVWGLLCAVALTAVHTFYWSNMRMRAPVMPMVYLACAVTCRGIYDDLRRRKLFSRNDLRQLAEP